MNHGPTRVNDVGNVPVLFVTSWAKERLAQPAEDSGWVFEIEQKGPDVVGTHGPHSVSEHQPAHLGLDRRPTIAQLNYLPRCTRDLACQPLFPSAWILRICDCVRLPIRSRHGGELPLDSARKEGQTLVRSRGAN